MTTDHDCSFVEFIDFHYAPIDDADPIRHTAFRLLRCVACRRVVPFPVENFLLTTTVFQSLLYAILLEMGRDLDDGSSGLMIQIRSGNGS